MALNKFICMGRLVADPELSKTQAGKSKATFTIAIDRNYKDDQGNRPSDFVKLVAWDKTAELVCSYFKKGRMISAVAEFRNNNWTDQQGNKRYDYYFEAREVSFCGDSQPTTTGAGSAAPSGNPAAAVGNPAAAVGNPAAAVGNPAAGYMPQSYVPLQNPAPNNYYQPSTEPVPHFETVDDSDLPF